MLTAEEDQSDPLSYTQPENIKSCRPPTRKRSLLSSWLSTICSESQALFKTIPLRYTRYSTHSCTCGGIHPGWFELAPTMEMTTPREEAPHARRACASSSTPFFETWWPERVSMSFLSEVAHVFDRPPAHFRHKRCGVCP